MILCFERFDREPPIQPAPAFGGTFPRCVCKNEELFPIGDPTLRKSKLRLRVPLALLADRHGRLVTRRVRTTTS